jgi:hypothetical protein
MYDIVRIFLSIKTMTYLVIIQKKLFKNANKLTKRFFFEKNLFKIYQIETLKSDYYPDTDRH